MRLSCGVWVALEHLAPGWLLHGLQRTRSLERRQYRRMEWRRWPDATKLPAGWLIWRGLLAVLLLLWLQMG